MRKAIPLFLLLLACDGSGNGSTADAGPPGPPGPDAFASGEPGDVIGHLATRYSINAVAAGDDGRVFVLTSSSFARVGVDGAFDPAIDAENPTGRFEGVFPAPGGKWLLIKGDNISRLNADYSFDTTYTAELDGLYVNGVATAPDGSVYAVGTREVGSGEQVVLRKLDASGALVIESFTPPELDLRGSGVAVLPDGRAFVRAEDGFTPALVRFTAAGAYDGVLLLTELGPRYSRAQLVDTAGGILVLGMSNSTIQIARVTPELTLDPAFGVAGVAKINVTMPLSSEYDEHVEARAMALQADGKIVVGANYEYDLGEDDVLEEESVLVIRFTADGQRDARFGDAGAVRVCLAAGNVPSTIAYRFGLTVSGERIVIGGDTTVDNMIHGAITALWQ